MLSFGFSPTTATHTYRASIIAFLALTFGLLTTAQSWATPARVKVTKKIACVPPNADCATVPASQYKGIKTGFMTDTQLPGFCYQITITNSTAFNVVGIEVTDDHLDLTGCNFPTTLPPRGSFTCYVATEHDVTTTNVVTAIGAKEGTILFGMSKASAIAKVLPASIACTKRVTSPDDIDGDPSDSHVTLPADGQSHSLTYSVTVTNTGASALKNVIIKDQMLVDEGCVLPKKFMLPIGGSTNITLCTIQRTCDDLPINNTIMISADIKTRSTECATDMDGQPITVASTCSASVGCGGTPRLEVTKEIACQLSDENCGTFGESATGVRINDQDPFFCYRITITNSGQVVLENIKVDDNVLGDLSALFPATLAVGGSDSQIIVTNHSDSVANTVSVEADGVQATGRTMANDGAAAIIQEPSLSCEVCASSTDDLDGDANDCHVSLLANGADHTVTYSITVTNSGAVALSNLTVTDPQLPSGCLPPPFNLAPNTATTIVCQVTQNCDITEALTHTVNVSGGVDISEVECAPPAPLNVIETTCQNVIDCVPCDLVCSVSPESAEVCEGGSQEFTANPTGGTAPYTFSWDTGATTSNITVSASGTYEVTVTDSKGCTTTCEASLSVNLNPSCTVTPPSAEICDGGSQEFTVNPTGGTAPFTFSWDTGATTSNITVSAAGTYKVTVTDSKGCTTTCEAALSVNPNPSCTVTPPSGEICDGSSQEFTANPTGGTAPYSFSWNSGETTSNITVSAAGTYTVTVTDAKGCTTTCEAALTVNPNPSCTIEPPTAKICDGGSQEFTVQPTGGTAPYTFLWSTTATTSNITVSAAGTYSVTVTDAKGCTTSCEASLTVETPGNITCTKVASSPDDLDGVPDDDNVLLPTDGSLHNVTYSVQVTAGVQDLTNVTIEDLSLGIAGCTMPAPFSLPANSVTNFVLCTVPLSCQAGVTNCATFPTLGAANGFGVLALGANDFKMSGPKTLVNTIVGIGPNATGQFDAGQVTGQIIVDPDGTLAKVNVPNGGIVTQSLTQAVADALQASADAAALTPTQTFSDILVGQTIVGNGGTNVIKVDNKFTLSTDLLTLQGGPNDVFIFNIYGQFKFDGGSKVILQGGVLPSNVLFNILGDGDSVKISGGLDGDGIPKTQLVGTVLAPQRTVSFTGSMITGALISGEDIHMDSGARLICSGGQTPPPSLVNTVIVTADSFCGQVTSQCSATVHCQ